MAISHKVFIISVFPGIQVQELVYSHCLDEFIVGSDTYYPSFSHQISLGLKTNLIIF